MAVNMPLSIQISTRLTPPGPAAWPSILISWTAGKLRPSIGTSIHAEASLDAGKLHAPSTRTGAKSRLQMIRLHGNERMRSLRGVRGFGRPLTVPGRRLGRPGAGRRVTGHADNRATCTAPLASLERCGLEFTATRFVRRVSFSDPRRGGALLLAGFPLVYYLTSTPDFQDAPWRGYASLQRMRFTPISIVPVLSPSARVSPLAAASPRSTPAFLPTSLSPRGLDRQAAPCRLALWPSGPSLPADTLLAEPWYTPMTSMCHFMSSTIRRIWS